MLKNKKRIISWLLVLTLGLGIVGCAPKANSAEVRKEFDVFVDSLPSEFVSSDDMNLEFVFKNPQNYGFDEEILNLPYATKEDYQDSANDSKELLKKLDAFSYKDLTLSQQLTYDVLKDSLNRGIVDDKFYYLDNNYLGSFIGFQAQLPLLLSEYTFERQNDLDSYFHILETSPEVFKKYADNEKERQKQNVGMSQNILNKVIEQCNNFTKDKDVFLIEDINKKIDKVEFLNEQQKQEAKKKNEDLLKNKYLKAYTILKEELSTIKGRTDDVGLSQLPNGKEYYEYLLKAKVGVDDSVKDIKKYLEKQIKACYVEMAGLSVKYPNIIEDTDFDSLKYTSSTSFEETIDYLSQQIKKDYPETETINYSVKTVPDAMKDNFSPAAYLQGKIDASDDELEQIWVNGKFDQNLFTTLAHEGFSGHMYQHVYFKRLKLPTIRYLLDYNGYSEGWATYIENNSYQYAENYQEQEGKFKLYQLNQKATEAMVCLIDIGIHYEGWTYDEYKTYMKENFGSLEETDLKEQYDLFIETPTNYMQYYLSGMRLQELHDDAKKELGDKFKETDFNKVILETGPSSFDILEKQVQKYIDTTK
ncbi:MAG: DUF885 domain-containing protein [Coprobacillus sp.]